MKRFLIALVVAAVVVPPLAVAASRTHRAGGTWRRLPAAPVSIDAYLTGVWTGSELVVAGVTGVARDGNFLDAADVAEAYDPRARTWRRLAAPPPNGDRVGRRSAVWTGREMLVWNVGAYDPATDRWRRLPRAPAGGGLVVWTGREMIGWGGGCCGDAFADGAAYDPVTDSWRRLAHAPLAGSQSPLGVWTGRELVVFVGGLGPDGKRWPARLARAAAYNPRTNTWRRIAALPAPCGGARAVWDGRDVLVVGCAGAARAGRPAVPARTGFAYHPATNRWQHLAPMPSGRFGANAVWTGKRLLLWGGSKAAGDPPPLAADGLTYDPRTARWSRIPQAPLVGRLQPAGVWTGHALIVWGGNRPATPAGSGTKFLADGAAFAPSAP